ncbi:MAG: cysteine hydrolase [SAR202 cluster bacterium]|nr:cysteine hydrolase [SAR202 cluster bacterium]
MGASPRGPGEAGPSFQGGAFSSDVKNGQCRESLEPNRWTRAACWHRSRPTSEASTQTRQIATRNFLPSLIASPTNLIITGVTTEVCVQTSMRAANDRGYDCVLVEDGTGSYFPDFQQSVLKQVVAQHGIIGWTAHSAEIIKTLAALTQA